MAVYEQTYRPYAGPLSSAWARRLVIPRYAFGQLFQSRLFSIFFALCFVYPLGHAAYLYVVHNLGAFAKLGIKVDAGEMLSLGAKQLQLALSIQGFAAGLVLTLIVGPTLIARDLHNNGLALYLSRPLTKWGYIGGKFAVLATLLSAVTWVPVLLLYVFNSVLEGGDWFFTHLHWAVATFAGAWILIALYCLVALAASALLKWRPVAMAAIFGLMIFGAAFGAALNATLDTSLGSVFDALGMVQVLWGALFGEMLNPEHASTPLPVAVASVLLYCGTALLVLARRVRAYEVVR